MIYLLPSQIYLLNLKVYYDNDGDDDDDDDNYNNNNSVVQNRIISLLVSYLKTFILKCGVYKYINSGCFYGCEIWPLTLKKCRLRVIENRC
jgi:hypothetical protein